MQSLSWDNYQFVLAIYRCQTLAGAARSLGVNETTVSRRLAQLEKTLQNALFSRNSTGLVPTDSGLKVIQRLERAKLEIDEAEAEVASQVSEVDGKLRVSCNALLMSHMLVPHLHNLLQQHSSLSCELVTIADSDPVSGCGVTLRYRDSSSFTRAKAGSDDSFVLGKVEFGLFAANSLNDGRAVNQIPWLEHSGGVTNHSWGAAPIHPQANTLGAMTRVRVASAEVLLACVLAGLGKCLLPMGVGCRYPELFLLPEDVSGYHQYLVRVAQTELVGTDRLVVCDEWLVRCIDSFIRT